MIQCRSIAFPLYIIIVCLACVPPHGFAQLPGYRWAVGLGSAQDDTAHGLVTDAAGNSFIAGYASGVAEFSGTPPVTSRGGQDAFAVRLDSSGRGIWAVRFGGTNSDIGHAIALDPLGNVFVTGVFGGEADFAGTNLTSIGQDDCFVVKLSSSGEVLWARQAGGINADAGLGISCDALGNCIVTGSFRHTASFGKTNLTSGGQSDLFLAKYDPDGELLWVRQAGGGGVDEGLAVATSAQGDIWLTGRFAGLAEFGGTNVMAEGFGDIFLARYTPDGEVAWVKSAGSTNTFVSDFGAGITVDAEQNCYVSGSFMGNGRFGPAEIRSDPAAIFLAKYNSFGDFLWVRTANTSSGGSGNDLVIDPRGTIIMGGHFVGRATFGSTTLTNGQADSFVAGYSAAGEFLWVVNSGGSGYNQCLGIGIGADSHIYTAGWYRASTTFGGIQVTNRAIGRDAYIARVDGPPSLRISVSEGNLLLSWSVHATNYQLQSSASLRPTNWAVVTNTVSVQGMQRFINVAASNASHYYRLLRP